MPSSFHRGTTPKCVRNSSKQWIKYRKQNSIRAENLMTCSSVSRKACAIEWKYVSWTLLWLKRRKRASVMIEFQLFGGNVQLGVYGWDPVWVLHEVLYTGLIVAKRLSYIQLSISVLFGFTRLNISSCHGRTCAWRGAFNNTDDLGNFPDSFHSGVCDITTTTTLVLVLYTHAEYRLNYLCTRHDKITLRLICFVKCSITFFPEKWLLLVNYSLEMFCYHSKYSEKGFIDC